MHAKQGGVRLIHILALAWLLCTGVRLITGVDLQVPDPLGLLLGLFYCSAAIALFSFSWLHWRRATEMAAWGATLFGVLPAIFLLIAGLLYPEGAERSALFSRPGVFLISGLALLQAIWIRIVGYRLLPSHAALLEIFVPVLVAAAAGSQILVIATAPEACAPGGCMNVVVYWASIALAIAQLCAVVLLGPSVSGLREDPVSRAVLVLVILIIGLGFGYFRMSLPHEQSEMQRIVDLGAERLSDHVERTANRNLRVVADVAEHWSGFESSDQAAWEHDVGDVLLYGHAFQALFVVDESGRIVRTARRPGILYPPDSLWAHRLSPFDVDSARWSKQGAVVAVIIPFGGLEQPRQALVALSHASSFFGVHEPALDSLMHGWEIRGGEGSLYSQSGAEDGTRARYGQHRTIAANEVELPALYLEVWPSYRASFMYDRLPVILVLLLATGSALVVWLHDYKRRESQRQRLVADREAAERMRAEHNFGVLLDQDVIGIFVLRDDDRLYDANRKLCEIMGRDPQDLIGREIFDFMSPESRESFKRQRAANLPGIPPKAHRVEIRTPAGEVRHLEVRIGPPSAERMGVVLDITAEVLHQREKAERDRRNRALVENGSDLICVIDDRMRFDYVSPSSRHILGRRAEALVNTTVLTLRPAVRHERRSLLRAFQRARHGVATTVTCTIPRYGDGSLRTLEIRLTPYRADERDQSGAGWSWVVVNARDITDILDAERSYTQIFQHSPEAIFTLERDGYRIRDANPAAERIFGRPKEDLVGQVLQTFVERDDAPLVAETIGDVLEGHSSSLEMGVLHSDGRTRRVVISANRTAHGKIVVHGADVTEAREQTERANRSETLANIGKAVAEIAHEVNSPLMAISGITEGMLQSGTLSFDGIHKINRELEWVFAFMHSVRERMLRTKLPVDGKIREPEEVNVVMSLNDAVQESLADRRLRSYVERTGHSPELRLSDDLPDILAPPGGMRSVVTNLVENGWKAMESSDTAKWRLIVETRAEEQGVVLEVSDTGCGISQSQLGRIFQPITSGRADGHGIGLGLVQRIVNEMGGVIDVDSRVGQGSRFTLWFPAAPESDSRPRSRSDTAIASGFGRTDNPLRILLADDHTTIQWGLGQYLRNRGHEVFSAGSGAGVLQHLAEGVRPDVLLSDVCMPGMSAEDLLNRIAEDYPEVRSRVIWITGGSTDTAILAFISSTGRPCLFKPLKLDATVAEIERIAREQAMAGSTA